MRRQAFALRTLPHSPTLRVHRLCVVKMLIHAVVFRDLVLNEKFKAGMVALSKRHDKIVAH